MKYFLSPTVRRVLFAVAAVLGVLCGSFSHGLAQDSAELTLAVRRDWGFGGGSQIQGLFTLEASGPADLVSVMFKIDDTILGEIPSPPFKIQFDTDDFPNGWHALTAIGRTRDGRSLTSNVRNFEFVTADYAWAFVQQRILGLGALVGILIVVMLAIQSLPRLLGKQTSTPPGAQITYGLLGGAICPKCSRSFAIHWWSLNAGLHQKYDRCDHCGRWSFVRRATPAQLADAEADELTRAQPAEATPEEHLTRQLDDSRYVDDE